MKLFKEKQYKYYLIRIYKMEQNNELIKIALKQYECNKKAKRNYYMRNQEKIKEYGKSYYQRIKEDPEKYKEYLERCNKKYERIRDDPEKYEAYLKKEKERYYAKKQEKETL